MSFNESMYVDFNEFASKEFSTEQSQQQDSDKILKHFLDNTQDKIDLFIEEYGTNDTELDELSKYLQDNDTADMSSEIYLRFCQSIINRWDQKTSAKARPRSLIDLTHNLFETFVEQSNIEDRDFVERLLNVLSPLMKESKFDANAVHQRNICLILNVALARYDEYCFSDGARDKMLQYLVKIVEDSQYMETVLLACFNMEALAYRQQISKDLAGRVRKALQKYADNLNQCPLSILSSPNFDRVRYQVGHCSRWLIDAALVDKKSVQLDEDSESIPLNVKLSPDCLSARCDKFCQYPSVCSAFPVSSGTFYYEVTLLTNGPITIGWATRETDFNEGIGSDPYSIGFDGANKVVVNGGQRVPVDKAWKEGDIIGCLIDVPKRKFSFFLNGKKVEYSSRTIESANNFSAQSYYAVAQLSPHQQCYFNFGQTGFKFPSRGISYSDFHTESNEDVAKYRLLVPSQTQSGSYWFKKEPLPDDNRVEPFFRDDKQNAFDRWIIKLVCKLTDYTNSQEDYSQALEEEFKELMAKDEEQGLLRLIQSVIEELGSVIKENKIDIVVELIEQYLGQLEGQQRALNTAKLLELLYPYMQLQAKCLCDKSTIKHRNLCLVLSLVNKLMNEDGNDLEKAQGFLSNKEVIGFLAKIFNDCEHSPSQLYAVICLDSVNPELVSSAKFASKLEEMARFLAKCSFECLYTPTFDYYRYQIAFCSQWHLDRLAKSQQSSSSSRPQVKPSGADKAKLDLKDMTSGMKISFDRLCARSDADWQSVASVFPITSGVYFYEIILLTSGSMRIGWATKECEFEVGKSVGNDEYSIGYDGHNKKICHIYGDYTLLKKNVRQWKAGDVVGCLIDVAEKRFAFYLNGLLIEYQTEVFFSPQPYFAAVSLSAHQMCYFNFGQAAFKYAPVDVEYRDFYNAIAKNLCPFCSNSEAIARFANCDHWNVCLECMGRLKKCPTCNPTQE